ncbi:MAG: helix-turn-helix domain-containing protein [Mariprofundus sp.]|nr:helix-turn-helix domain-containing protein [Mariprofundus sp.]
MKNPETKPANEEKVEPVDPYLALLAEIGGKLNTARIAISEPLDTPARKLKLRRKHLYALETGIWDEIPDKVYGLGFLRQYSDYLKLDLTEEIERLKNSNYTLTRPMTFPDPPVAPSKRWAWLSASLFIILMLAYNFTNLGSQKEVIHHAPSIASDIKAKASSSRLALEPSDSAETESNKAPIPLPIKENKQPPQAEKQNGQANNISSPPAENINTQIAKTHLYRFKAVDDAVWLQLSSRTDGHSKLIKEVLLEKGKAFSIRHPSAKLWLTCGNAPALRIFIDGKLFTGKNGLGEGKKIVRDYKISPNR